MWPFRRCTTLCLNVIIDLVIFIVPAIRWLGCVRDLAESSFSPIAYLQFVQHISSAFVQSLARPIKSDLGVSDRKPTKHLDTPGHDYSNSFCNTISESSAVRHYHSEQFGGSNFEV